MEVDHSIVDCCWKRYSRSLFLGICLLQSVSYANASQDLTAIKSVAEQGNATAQTNLGDSYYNGEGVTQDYQQANLWYRKAAEQGYADAQNKLAFSYFKGDGVSQDFKQAVSWYRKAAEQGYAKAQTNLGASYFYGQGVTQDLQQANDWYRKAAEQGHAPAQFSLGNSYFKGDGAPRDFQQAAFWYRKAAEQGYAKDQIVLAMKQIAAIERAESDAKLKILENTNAQAQSKVMEIANDAKYSGGLSEALQNNKDKGVDWFKNKIFKLDKTSAITACDPGICYIFAFNGLSSIGVTQENQDFNGRQLQGQFVRVIGTDRLGNIVVTRLTSNNKPAQKPRPSTHEKPQQQPNLPGPALATYDEIVDSIDGLIIARAAEGWARPKSTREGMTVVLQIEMLQNGTIKSVSVAKSSGDTPFDNSAVTAVKDIGSLPEMQYLKPNDFQPYRSFKMTFRPEDLGL